MARYDVKRVSDSMQTKLLGELWEAIAGLHQPQVVGAVMSDLFHPQELLMLARRIQIAKMLREGFRFDEIGLLLRTAPNTIGKVNRELRHGQGGLAKLTDSLLKAQTSRAALNRRDRSLVTWERARWYARLFWPETLLAELEVRWQELQRLRGRAVG